MLAHVSAMKSSRHSRRTNRPDLYRREAQLRLGAILVSAALLAFTCYLVWSHQGMP